MNEIKLKEKHCEIMKLMISKELNEEYKITFADLDIEDIYYHLVISIDNFKLYLQCDINQEHYYGIELLIKDDIMYPQRIEIRKRKLKDAIIFIRENKEVIKETMQEIKKIDQGIVYMYELIGFKKEELSLSSE